jgi:hypothetical protein
MVEKDGNHGMEIMKNMAVNIPKEIVLVFI